VKERNTSEQIQENQLWWLGSIVRREDEDVGKRVRRSWEDCVKEDMWKKKSVKLELRIELLRKTNAASPNQLGGK